MTASNELDTLLMSHGVEMLDLSDQRDTIAGCIKKIKAMTKELTSTIEDVEIDDDTREQLNKIVEESTSKHVWDFSDGRVETQEQRDNAEDEFEALQKMVEQGAPVIESSMEFDKTVAKLELLMKESLIRDKKLDEYKYAIESTNVITRDLYRGLENLGVDVKNVIPSEAYLTSLPNNAVSAKMVSSIEELSLVKKVVGVLGVIAIIAAAIMFVIHLFKNLLDGKVSSRATSGCVAASSNSKKSAARVAKTVLMAPSKVKLAVANDLLNVPAPASPKVRPSMTQQVTALPLSNNDSGTVTELDKFKHLFESTVAKSTTGISTQVAMSEIPSLKKQYSKVLADELKDSEKSMRGTFLENPRLVTDMLDFIEDAATALLDDCKILDYHIDMIIKKQNGLNSEDVVELDTSNAPRGSIDTFKKWQERIKAMREWAGWSRKIGYVHFSHAHPVIEQLHPKRLDGHLTHTLRLLEKSKKSIEQMDKRYKELKRMAVSDTLNVDLQRGIERVGFYFGFMKFSLSDMKKVAGYYSEVEKWCMWYVTQSVRESKDIAAAKTYELYIRERLEILEKNGML